MTAALTPETVLRDYFRAKDENRPWLLGRVFAPDAELAVVNRTSTIEFPALTKGRAGIAEILVSGFGRTYENVYSFYLERPPAPAKEFCCDWLVAMSEKETKCVRVGCGGYRWTFGEPPRPLAARLEIVIEEMQVLPPEELDATFAWVQRLSYPWSSAVEVAQNIPYTGPLGSVLGYLARRPRDA